jgi:hypothetical protein
MSVSALKVPAIIASSLICLGIGVGVGAVGAIYLGITDMKAFWRAHETPTDEGVIKLEPPKGVKGLGVPKGGFAAGMAMAKAPSAKVQLNTLVAKLDTLTARPLTVTFSDEQKKKVQEQLHGLATLDELSEDDAKQRLDGLLDVLQDQRESLTAAGYRWPGEQGGGGFGGPKEKENANPFKDEANAKRLESLEKRLTKTSS